MNLKDWMFRDAPKNGVERRIKLIPQSGEEPEEPDYGDSERTVDEDGYPIKKENK